VEVTSHDWWHAPGSSVGVMSEELVVLLARLPRLVSLRINGLDITRAALKQIASATAATEPNGAADGKAPFANLQHLKARLGPNAAAVLAQLFPAALTTLDLELPDEAAELNSSSGGGHSDDNGAGNQLLRLPPLVHVVDAAAARAAALRKLVVLYYGDSIAMAELDALRRLPQLEELSISGRGLDCRTCRHAQFYADTVAAPPGFAGADVACLLAGLPRLTHLKLYVPAQLPADMLRLVGRSCRRLRNVNLWGDLDVYGVCLGEADAPFDEAPAHGGDKDDDGAAAAGPPDVLFPELVWLEVTTIVQPDEREFSEKAEDVLLRAVESRWVGLRNAGRCFDRGQVPFRVGICYQNPYPDYNRRSS
jgi:hypothetical protein